MSTHIWRFLSQAFKLGYVCGHYHTPDDQRGHYVEGGGQLCEECYARIYCKG